MIFCRANIPLFKRKFQVIFSIPLIHNWTPKKTICTKIIAPNEYATYPNWPSKDIRTSNCRIYSDRKDIRQINILVFMCHNGLDITVHNLLIKIIEYFYDPNSSMPICHIRDYRNCCHQIAKAQEQTRTCGHYIWVSINVFWRFCYTKYA